MLQWSLGCDTSSIHPRYLASKHFYDRLGFGAMDVTRQLSLDEPLSSERQIGPGSRRTAPFTTSDFEPAMTLLESVRKIGREPEKRTPTRGWLQGAQQQPAWSSGAPCPRALEAGNGRTRTGRTTCRCDGGAFITMWGVLRCDGGTFITISTQSR